MIIMIDPGHGGNDSGAVGPSGAKEKDINLAVAERLHLLMSESGIEAYMTRIGDEEVSLAKRAEKANNISADYFISIHCNAANSPTAHGTETYHYPGSVKGRALAQAVQQELVSATGLADRGVKEANFYVLRMTAMPAILVELAFLSNPEEERLLATSAFQEKCARAIWAGVKKATGIKQETSILHAPRATVGQAQAWAKAKGATDVFIGLADLYWRIAPSVGVDPVVAYCQAAKETGYGKFGGVIDETYHNPCGLKTSEGGGNYDPRAHQRFASWEDGVSAHIDHLALYAGAPGYPKKGTLDPRHFPYLLGTAKTVEALGGKWAPSATYGEDIVRLMQELIATPEPAWEDVSPWAREAWVWAVENGITDGTRPKGAAT
ncbi:MAG TPA: N-acetylmuramoyl-L-alanine amidase, partial [Bacillota bacterium]|nr:N-acetylmuramoyl-L-alanine amidase [Bacillota bacterium]